MKKILQIVMLFISIQFTCIVSTAAQKWKSEVFEHTKEFLQNYNDSASGKKEILLIGTFHFRSNPLQARAVENQIIDFQPDALFLEEVPPSDQATYKEHYKDVLYTSEKRGPQFYSKTIDSEIEFSGITREEARQVIEENYALLKSDPDNINNRVQLINALFIIGDDPNALLQIAYLKEILENDGMPSFEEVQTKIAPAATKHRFYMGETKYLSVPVAAKLRHEKVYPMDYQKTRVEVDSLLSIVIKKMMPRLAIKVWKLPYLIRMMSLEQNTPENEKDAVKQFRILNKHKTFKNLAKLNEVYPYHKKSDASKEWIRVYRDRNREMVSLVKRGIDENDLNNIAIIVGTGHIPHFIYEINKQLPDYSIRLLDIEQL